LEGATGARMSLLMRLENKYQHLAIPQLTLFLVIGQAIFFVIQTQYPETSLLMALVPAEVLSGELWRLFSFVFIPPSTNLIFALIGLYFFYFMGTGLENKWGPFRYNLYLLLGYLSTVIASFFFLGTPANNVFFEGSVLLAFAFCFPNFEFLLFFIIPCRMKWLGWLTGVFFIGMLIIGPWPQKLQIVASFVPFLLFFGRDIFAMARSGRDRMKHKMKYVEVKPAKAGDPEAGSPFHHCAECDKTDISHPKMDFRYCDECEGHFGFCSDHIRKHSHRTQ
jgi:hypothetical protein